MHEQTHIKGRLLKGKKLFYGVQKKQARTIWFENMGVCRYRKVVSFEISSLQWHSWWGNGWEWTQSNAILGLGGVFLLITFFTSLALAEELFKKSTSVHAPCAATDGRYHRIFLRTLKRKSIQENLRLLITRLLFRTCQKKKERYDPAIHRDLW